MDARCAANCEQRLAQLPSAVITIAEESKRVARLRPLQCFQENEVVSVIIENAASIVTAVEHLINEAIITRTRQASRGSERGQELQPMQ
jgi:hypothetical protein